MTVLFRRIRPQPVNKYIVPTMLSRSGWTTHTPTTWAELKTLADNGINRSTGHHVIYLNPALLYTPAGSSFDTITFRGGHSTNWLYVMPDETSYAGIAPEGTRFNTSQTSWHGNMPHVQGRAVNCPTWQVAKLARKIRFVGIEISHSGENDVLHYHSCVGRAIGDGSDEKVDSPSEFPQEIVYDRCYLRGSNTWVRDHRDGLFICGKNIGVVDSRIEWIRADGYENHAILIPWACSGVTVENCYLDAGICCFTGGTDDRWEGAQHEDIAWNYNECTLSPKWNPNDPIQYVGRPTIGKNGLELKGGDRVEMVGNWIHDIYKMDTNQGPAIVIKCNSQNNWTPWKVLRDILIQGNLCANNPRGLQIVSADGARQVAECSRIQVYGNAFIASQGLESPPRLLAISHPDQPSWNPDYQIKDVTIRQNTWIGDIPEGASWTALNMLEFGIMATSPACTRLTYEGNLTDGGWYGIKMSGVSGGTPSLDAFANGDWTVRNNVAFHYNSGDSYPAGFGHLLSGIADVGFDQTTDPHGSWGVTGPYADYGANWKQLLTDTMIARTGVRF